MREGGASFSQAHSHSQPQPQEIFQKMLKAGRE